MLAISRWKYAAIALWLGGWLYSTRYAMLDDALIHLRYAVFLNRFHFITYDGVHPSYGTSSLLYVSLLALLRNVIKSAMLPKATSTVFYLLWIGILLLLGRQFKARSIPRLLWWGLLFAALSPMAIRWLTDGMETSLVLCGVGALGWLVSVEARRTRASAASYAALVLLAAALVFLRTEISSLLGLSTLSLLAVRARISTAVQGRGLLLLHATALGAGAILAMGTIRYVEGNFLPDTALAKSAGLSLIPLIQVAEVTASSLVLGVGTTLVAVLSAVFYLRYLRAANASRSELLSWVFANAGYPLFLVLACVRGQAIQGVRYVLWTLVFATVWNLTGWAARPQTTPSAVASRMPETSLAYACAVLFLCLLPVDWHFAWRAMSGRAQTYLAMRDANLRQYKSDRIVAGDVGFIGYFTTGSICDLNGLVNGRVAAATNEGQRVRDCARDHPPVLFVSIPQANYLSYVLDMNTYTVCRKFDFQNVRHNDRHYLMVSLTSPGITCPAGEGSGVSASTLLMDANHGKNG